jgi:hypothetical protein
MLDHLDEALELFLERELCGIWEKLPKISFATPDGDFISTVQQLTLNLFLYNIQENLEYRNNGWQTAKSIEQSNGDNKARKITRTPFPLRVDCSYLVTAWAKGATPEDQKQQEHELLGEVMRVLMRYRQLPTNLLQGCLEGQELPIRVLGLRPPQLQSIGEFWQAMGASLRLP